MQEQTTLIVDEHTRDSKLASFFKKAWSWYYSLAFKPEQELKIDFQELIGEDRTDCYRYLHWSSGLSFLMGLINVLLLGLLIYSAYIVLLTKEATISEMFPMFLMFLALLGPALLAIPDNRKQALSKLTTAFWNDPEITEARKNYKYFYVRVNSIVFTNANPPWFCMGDQREKTHYNWPSYRPNRLQAFLEWLFFSTIYLRFLWPFVLSPLQLAFLAYPRAKKYVSFEPGMKVLIIGSGPLPYHCWWKSKLGSQGSITALDINPYVNRTSFRVETLFEKIRSLFAPKRWVSDHIVGDAEELPFDSSSFDIVVAIRCYHVNIEEGLRVLENGGKLLVDEYSQITNLYRDTQQIEEPSGWRLLTA